MATAKSQSEHDRLVNFIEDIDGILYIWLGMTDDVSIVTHAVKSNSQQDCIV